MHAVRALGLGGSSLPYSHSILIVTVQGSINSHAKLFIRSQILCHQVVRKVLACIDDHKDALAIFQAHSSLRRLFRTAPVQVKIAD